MSACQDWSLSTPTSLWPGTEGQTHTFWRNTNKVLLWKMHIFHNNTLQVVSVCLFLPAQTDSWWLPATAPLQKKKKKKRRESFSAPICTNKAGPMVGSYAPSMTTTHTETLLWLILETQTRQWTHHCEDMKMKMNSKTTRKPFHLEKIEKIYCNFKKAVLCGATFFISNTVVMILTHRHTAST